MILDTRIVNRLSIVPLYVTVSKHNPALYHDRQSGDGSKDDGRSDELDEHFAHGLAGFFFLGIPGALLLIQPIAGYSALSLLFTIGLFAIGGLALVFSELRSSTEARD